MSYDAIDWAFEQDAKGYTQLVLIRLAHHHNWKTGRCNPSVATLARTTGLHRSTVMKAIAQLTQAGLITPTKRNGTSTAYRLAFVPKPVALADRSLTATGRSQQPDQSLTATGTGRSQRPKQGTEQGKNLSGAGRIIRPQISSTRHRTLAEDLTDTTWAD